jgi:hypothetical protein
MTKSKRETRFQVAVRIRDIILPKLRAAGSFTGTDGLRLFTYRTLTNSPTYFDISLLTPFQGDIFRSHRAYRRLAERGSPSCLNLPYGLDIWSKAGKVLNLEWAEDGRIRLVSLRRGEWENAVIEWATQPQRGSLSCKVRPA